MLDKKSSQIVFYGIFLVWHQYNFVQSLIFPACSLLKEYTQGMLFPLHLTGTQYMYMYQYWLYFL